MVPFGSLSNERVRDAAAHGLSVIAECAFDTAGPQAEILRAYPAWRASTAGHGYQLLDPRQAPRVAHGVDLPLHDPASSQAIVDWRVQQLCTWANIAPDKIDDRRDGCGIGAVCVSLDGSAPPEFFATLIQAVKQQHPLLRFLAWTPGVAAERVASMAGVGFEAAFGSCAWWDFQAGWLADEARRLQPFAALIGLVQPAVFSYGECAVTRPAIGSGNPRGMVAAGDPANRHGFVGRTCLYSGRRT